MENNKTYIYKIWTRPNKKLTHIVYYKHQQRSFVKMSIDPKFVELTADVLKIFL